MGICEVSWGVEVSDGLDTTRLRGPAYILLLYKVVRGVGLSFPAFSHLGEQELHFKFDSLS